MKSYQEFREKLENKNFKSISNVDTNTPAGKAILKVRNKFRGIIGDSGFLLLNIVEIVKFMLLHDKFASLGIYITEENKEEKYIEILEKDDEKLLNDLEEYIETQERVSILVRAVDIYDKLIQKIKEVDENDEEEINKIISDYLEI